MHISRLREFIMKKEKMFFLIFLLFVLFLLSGCFVEKTDEELLENGVVEEQIEILENQYFTIKNLSTDTEQKYEYIIYNKYGNIVLKEESYREPNINLLSENLLEIRTSHGSSAVLFRYYDIKNDCLSTDSFWNRSFVVDNKIFYMDINKENNRMILIVRDIFDKTKYYKEFERDFSKTAVPSLALKSIKILDKENFEIEYFSGEQYELKQEVISIIEAE